MKVLIFSHNFLPSVDGGSQVMAKISQILSSSAEVTVFTSDAVSTDDYLDPKAKRLKSEGNIVRLKTARKISRLTRRLTMGPIFAKLPILPILMLKPKVIIAGVFPTIMPFYAYLASLLTGAKLILVPCFHTGDPEFYRPYLKFVLKRANKIAALSQHEKQFYIKKMGISQKKVFIFKPPVEKKLLLSGQVKFIENPTILFLGSQSAHKKIELLIKAFEVINQKYPKSRLIIAGQRTLYSPLIEKAIVNNTKIIFNPSEDEKINLIDQAWVLVNPSVHESLGLVFLEAWARKKPVIGADIPTLRELIENGKNGFLFEKDNFNDLIDKIEKIINNQSKAEEFGKHGFKKIVKEYADNHSFNWLNP